MAELEFYRQAVAAVCPELRASPCVLLADGWDCIALDVGGEWIFKFPRSVEAGHRLRREATLLELVRAHVDMPVPELALHESPTLCSQHRKIPGASLLAEHYPRLTELQRDTLAESMALLHAQLHAIPPADAVAAGAQPIAPWLSSDDIVGSVTQALPARLRPYLERTLSAYAAIQRGPDEEVYGYFDGHGWNMAFDHDLGRLNGVFDFADSGIGARHQDLSYSGFISPDLTRRIAHRYASLTAAPVDVDRVLLYHGVLLLAELAEFAARPDRRQDAIALVESWSRMV